MDLADAEELVALLQAGWPRSPLPSTSVELYATALRRFDVDDGRVAVARLLESSVFMPTIKELLEEVGEVKASRPSDRPALPEGEWTAEDRRRALEETQDLRDVYFARHGGRRGGPDS